MRIIELGTLLSKKMKEKGHGDKEITLLDRTVKDVYFCTQCDEFHITLKDKET